MNLGINMFEVYIVLATCLAVTNGAILEAHFSQNGIVGSVLFTQHNTTTVKVKIAFNATLHTFGNNLAKIHEYPVSYDDKCSGIGLSRYDIATLAQKHLEAQMEFYTQNMTLQGPGSILGASFVVTNTNGDFQACAPILEQDKDTKYAVATVSNGTLAGKLEFIQQENGDTLIFGQISHSDGSNTIGNWSLNWGVARSKTNEMVPNCPAKVLLFTQNTTFRSDNCTLEQEDTCIIGDLSKKHGELKVGIHGGNPFLKIDKNLPLSGSNSILNHYLVIGSRNDPETVLACGIIKQQGPLNVRSEFTPKRNRGISGAVSFHQPSPYHGTTIKVDLHGLNNKTGGYHVHLYPIADPPLPSCSKASVGGHLNPYNIVDKLEPDEGSLDKYECGDISGKFGSLAGSNSYNMEKLDLNLQLFGYNSVIGRSIVIHENKDGSPRFTCSDIAPENGRRYSAKLNYTKDSVFRGFVKLIQYQQADGFMMPTIFVVDLNYANNTLETNEHNFHVHINPVGNDTSAGGVCMSCSNHYNPTDVNIKTKDSYNSQCDSKHPYRCELGDTSKKVGTYDVGKGKKIYVDWNTPLYGQYTVLGRSIVFHAPEKTAPRLACADIVPEESSTVKYFSLEGRYSRKDTDRMKTLKEIVMKGMNLEGEPWKMAYPRLSASSFKSECYEFSFYLVDKDPKNYEQKFKDLIKKKERTYEPCKDSENLSSARPLNEQKILLISAILCCFFLL